MRCSRAALRLPACGLVLCRGFGTNAGAAYWVPGYSVLAAGLARGPKAAPGWVLYLKCLDFATSWRTSVAGRRGVLARPASSILVGGGQCHHREIDRYASVGQKARCEECPMYARQFLGYDAKSVCPNIHAPRLPIRRISALILSNLAAVWLPVCWN